MAALPSDFLCATLAPPSEGCCVCFPFCWIPTKRLNEYSSCRNLQLWAQRCSGGSKASYDCLPGVVFKAFIVESNCNNSSKNPFNTLGSKRMSWEICSFGCKFVDVHIHCTFFFWIPGIHLQGRCIKTNVVQSDTAKLTTWAVKIFSKQ